MTRSSAFGSLVIRIGEPTPKHIWRLIRRSDNWLRSLSQRITKNCYLVSFSVCQLREKSISLCKTSATEKHCQNTVRVFVVTRFGRFGIAKTYGKCHIILNRFSANTLIETEFSGLKCRPLYWIIATIMTHSVRHSSRVRSHWLRSQHFKS